MKTKSEMSDAGLAKKQKAGKGLSARQLEKLAFRVMKFARSLEVVGGYDCEVGALKNHLDDSSTAIYTLSQRRRLEEAERADRGEVLWTIYHPMELPRTIFTSQKVVMRTPNRRIEHGLFYKPFVTVRTPGEEAYSDLKREWPVTGVAAVVARTEEAARQFARQRALGAVGSEG